MNSVQRSVDHFETSSGPNALFCSLWWPLITARTAITLKAHGVLARSHINPRETDEHFTNKAGIENGMTSCSQIPSQHADIGSTLLRERQTSPLGVNIGTTLANVEKTGWHTVGIWFVVVRQATHKFMKTRSSAITYGLRDTLCYSKCCILLLLL